MATLEHRSSSAPVKAMAGPADRKPLATLEPNTTLAPQQLLAAGPAPHAHHTPMKPTSGNLLAPPAGHAAAKASPGLLRGFFALISPEMARIRSTEDTTAALVAPNTHQTTTGTAATTSTREEAQQLECDETLPLGPIPIFLEEHHQQQHQQQQLDALTTQQQMQLEEHAAHQQQDLLHQQMQQQQQQQFHSGHLASTLEAQRVPMKSPMSTLLSAMKPAGLNVELPTPRGLSFTFTGEVSNPLTATYTSASAAAAAAANGAPLSARNSASRLGRTESRNSQDTITSPAPGHSPNGDSTFSAGAVSPASSPRFTCSDCTKSFPSNSALAMHLLVHTGEKPFACPQKGCAKRFRQKGHLVSHYRKHTGEKPFQCPALGCAKRFKDKSGLNTHVKRQHPGVSAAHVVATASSEEADEDEPDPALEAAIAEANLTLAALQSSTLAATGAGSAAGGLTPTATAISAPPQGGGRKRTHLTMRAPSAMTNPSVGGDTPVASPRHSAHSASTDTDADTSMKVAVDGRRSSGSESPSFVGVSIQHMDTSAAEHEEDRELASSNSTDAAGAGHNRRNSVHTTTMDGAAAATSATTATTRPKKKSRGPADEPIAAAAASAQVRGVLHTNTELVARAPSAGSSHFSPRTTVASPILFSSHLHAFHGGNLGVAPHPLAVGGVAVGGASGSGRSTPTTTTTTFASGSWHPQIPLPAPVQPHPYSHLTMPGGSLLHTHFLPPALPLTASSLAPSSSSHALATGGGALLNTSSTSAFSFKPHHALAAATPAL